MIAVTARLFCEPYCRLSRDRRDHGKTDLGPREILASAPLLLLTVLLGVAPFLVLDVVHATTQGLLP